MTDKTTILIAYLKEVAKRFNLATIVNDNGIYLANKSRKRVIGFYLDQPDKWQGYRAARNVATTIVFENFEDALEFVLERKIDYLP